MAQHGYVIDNQLFPQTRADINAVLQAILTQNSGPSAPSVFNAGTFWYDTVNQVLKRRNDSNTDWVGVASVDLTPEQIASIIDQLGDLATQDTVGVGDINPDAVGTTELSDGATTLAKLATNSVDNTKVVTNTLALDKLVQASANVLLGRRTSSGNVVEVPYTEAGYAVMNAADATAQRTALGLGSAALTTYETGTFTPVLQGSTTAGVNTYALQSGSYTKVGRRVDCEMRLTLSAVGTAGDAMAGNAVISGLPFAISLAQISTMAIGAPTNITFVAGTLGYYFQFATGSAITLGRLGVSGLVTAGSSVAVTEITNTTQFRVAFTYQSAS